MSSRCDVAPSGEHKANALGDCQWCGEVIEVVTATRSRLTMVQRCISCGSRLTCEECGG